jgi:hypothetical protein
MSQSPPERSCTSACDCSPFSFAVLSPQGASAAGREADLCRRSTAGAVSGSYDERLAPTSTSDAELTARGLRRESSRPSTPSSFGVHSPTDARNASTPTIGVSAPRSETSLKHCLSSKCCPAAPLGAAGGCYCDPRSNSGRTPHQGDSVCHRIRLRAYFRQRISP